MRRVERKLKRGVPVEALKGKLRACAPIAVDAAEVAADPLELDKDVLCQLLARGALRQWRFGGLAGFRRCLFGTVPSVAANLVASSGAWAFAACEGTDADVVAGAEFAVLPAGSTAITRLSVPDGGTFGCGGGRFGRLGLLGELLLQKCKLLLLRLQLRSLVGM